ncbi:MAG TPA: methyltransferase domain-containing protein [Planctomycetia bacterium]|nr:methyltransferase domain-containing protein [Planctomycetia bacterium]
MPRWGNLRRTRPFSANFGFERGVPVDRHYLHRFLEANRARIAGDVLEIQGTGYSRRYGGDALRTASSVDIDARHDPTFVCDLARADAVLPAESFDCILLPNTLQLVERLDDSLRQIMRLLRPGGAFLASVGGLLPLIPDSPDDEYFRHTPAGWRKLLAAAWPEAHVEVEGHGNCLAVCAAALGLALDELDAAELDANDPRMPVLVTILAVKPDAPGAAGAVN